MHPYNNYSYSLIHASSNGSIVLRIRASTEPPHHSISIANSDLLNSFSRTNSDSLTSSVQSSTRAFHSNAPASYNMIGALTALLRTQITPPMLAYALPIALLLNLVNNILVFCVLAGSERVRRALPATVRLYYLAMALNDVSNSLPMHLTYFLGVLSAWARTHYFYRLFLFRKFIWKFTILIKPGTL